MITTGIKLIGLVLLLITFGMAPDDAELLAWIGSFGGI